MEVDIIETAGYPQSFCIVKGNAFRKKNMAEENTVMEALGNLNKVCVWIYIVCFQMPIAFCSYKLQFQSVFSF